MNTLYKSHISRLGQRLFAMTALAVLSTGLMGSAAAQNGNHCDDYCPNATEWWEANPAAWPVSEVTVGVATYQQAEAMQILDLEWNGLDKDDPLLGLAAELIAAKLNMFSGQDVHPIEQIMDLSDEILAEYPLGSVAPSSVHGDISAFTMILGEYNDGLMAPLGVEMTSLEARADGRDVVLNWTTLSEIDNAGFDVQVLRPNATSFETVDFVAGAGSSTTSTQYSHRVRNVEFGSSIFRLRQVDVSGSFAYSAIIELEITPEMHLAIEAYPNPVRTTATITVTLDQNDNADVAVYDLLGRRVQTLLRGTLSAGSHMVSFDATSLPNGLYLYRAETSSGSAVGSITVVK